MEEREMRTYGLRERALLAFYEIITINFNSPIRSARHRTVSLPLVLPGSTMRALQHRAYTAISSVDSMVATTSPHHAALIVVVFSDMVNSFVSIAMVLSLHCRLRY